MKRYFDEVDAGEFGRRIAREGTKEVQDIFDKGMRKLHDKKN